MKVKSGIKLLNFLVIFFILIASKGFSQNNCLVANYKLDGNAFDNSSNNLHGNLYGALPDSNRFGTANLALHFNGIDDYIELGTDADFAQRTISLWFKVDTFLVDYSMVFVTDFPTIKYGFTGISVDNNGTNRINCTVGANHASYTNAKTNTWYHFVFLVDGNTVKYFINCQLIASFPNTNFNHSYDGNNKAHLAVTRNYGHFFKGTIDDVKIYNCALSKSEIEQLDSPNFNKCYTSTGQSSQYVVYPSPFINKITLQKPSQIKKVSYSFYNSIGQLITNGNTEAIKTEIDLSYYAKGLYFLKLEDSLNRETFKILKQ